MKRRELREHIFELLFRVEFNERDEMPEQMRLFFESLPELSPEDQAYMQKKYERIMEKLPEIDRLLGETAEGWKVSRMGKTDLTVLRLAVYEMEFDEDVPVGVAVNEAVELSKKFGGDGSPAFVNGILGKIGKMEAAEAEKGCEDRGGSLRRQEKQERRNEKCLYGGPGERLYQGHVHPGLYAEPHLCEGRGVQL